MKTLLNPRNLFYAAILIIYSSCGKLQGNVTPANNQPWHTTTASVYQPIVKGSFWRYQVTQNNISDTSLVMMTGVSNKYNGRTYYEASSSFKSGKLPNSTVYFSHDNDAYTYLTISAKDTLDEYYFNDTTKVQGTWTSKVNQSGYLNGKQARYVGQVVEQNIPFTVLGTTYTGVTHSKVYLQYFLGENNYSTAETYDVFIVKNIGIIASYTTNSEGSVTSSQLLFEYSIK